MLIKPSTEQVCQGDTFVEVCFALAIFSFIAMLAISAMNSNLTTIQTTLESEVARSELDAQTEAIRYIHEAYLGSRSTGKEGSLTEAWKTIANKAVLPKTAQNTLKEWPPSSCSLYVGTNQSKLMAVNTRNLGSNNSNNIIISGGNITTTNVVPKLSFKNEGTSLTTNTSLSTLEKAEGIWFFAVKGDNNKNSFYDIYVQSCWNSTDSNVPHTIDTVIRLYNPDSLSYNDASTYTDVNTIANTELRV